MQEVACRDWPSRLLAKLLHVDDLGLASEYFYRSEGFPRTGIFFSCTGRGGGGARLGILPTAAVADGAQKGRKAKIPDAHETGLEN